MARSLLGVRALSFPQVGGGNYVYYSGTMQDLAARISVASIIKTKTDDDIVFLPAGLFWPSNPNFESIIGAGFDTSMKITNEEGSGLIAVGDEIAEFSKDWTQITEEEFYKIVPKFAIIHHGGGENVTTHEYEEGMTWGEWVNSDYNTINALISDDNQVQILIPNNDWNATLGSKIDGWLYSDNIIKSEQYDAYY